MPMTSKSFVFNYLMRGNLIKACAIFGWFNRFDRFCGYFLSGWMSWFLYWLTKIKKSIYCLIHVVEVISPNWFVT